MYVYIYMYVYIFICFHTTLQCLRPALYLLTVRLTCMYVFISCKYIHIHTHVHIYMYVYNPTVLATNSLAFNGKTDSCVCMYFMYIYK